MEKKGFIAVHLGAGYHSHSKGKLYKALCQRALNQGMTLIKNGESASRIITSVVSLLEDSPLTNAGVGSNLTVEGKVECDSGMMEGESGLFSGIGAVANVKNPIRVAEELLYYQKENIEGSELVPPVLLVGEGATDFAISQEIETVDGDYLVTDTALKTYERCHFRLQGSTLRSKILNGVVENRKRKHYEPPSESESSYTEEDQGSLYSSDGTTDLFMPGRKGPALRSKSKIFKVPRPEDTMSRGLPRRQHQTPEQMDAGSFNASRDSTIREGHDNVQGFVKVGNKTGKENSSKNASCGDNDARYDTVGAICVDSMGNSCAGISSGGLILKLPGRVGHAAMYGSGCWANHDATDTVSSASCTSGCGEQILRTFLAKECCDFLESAVDDEMLNPSSFFKRKFLNSKLMHGEDEKLAGVIGLVVKRKLQQRPSGSFRNANTSARMSSGLEKSKVRPHGNQSRVEDNFDDDDQDASQGNVSASGNRDGRNMSGAKGGTDSNRTSESDSTTVKTESSLEFMIAHSTNSFCVGFYGGNDTSPTVMISRMPSTDLIGKSASGHVFHYDW